jgi:quinol monooxygenase YgiN
MDLFIFARFHARDGQQDAVASALRDVVPPTRTEPGCRAIDAYRSTSDSRLYYIHSRWVDEAAFVMPECRTPCASSNACSH